MREVAFARPRRKFSSCPGLTRASIDLRKNLFEVMDCRVKPGNDGTSYLATCADTASHFPFCLAQQSV
jgi:hypothetical protein